MLGVERASRQCHRDNQDVQHCSGTISQKASYEHHQPIVNLLYQLKYVRALEHDCISRVSSGHVKYGASIAKSLKVLGRQLHPVPFDLPQHTCTAFDDRIVKIDKRFLVRG